ncbi:MAG: serine hydrolase domain-containing protein, partial [Siphonobacter sp.]
MRYPLFYLAAILVLAACSKKVNSGTATPEERLNAFFKNTSDFSGVVLIADYGKPLYHKAFGYKNFDTKAEMTTSAIFELASVSKQFTAMTIMLLQEKGKLNYDDLIDKYIPGLPYPGITIRHLLNHTSGLPDYQEVMDQHWDKSKVAGNTDNIEYLIKYHPARLFEPGFKYEYSNTGYMLLASITENVSGQDFIAFCHANIFGPAGLIHTDIRTQQQKATLSDMAWGHLYVPEKKWYMRADSFPQFNYAIWLGNRKGPGRVSSTTSDLLKWDQALYTFVKPQTLQAAFSPATLTNGSLSQYGFGWMLDQHPKLGKVVRHTGDNPGYKTQFIRYIDANKTAIVL